MQFLRSNSEARFYDPPVKVAPFLHWPTDNRCLFSEPDRYFARTRANPDYGRPGFTRDCGKRFHRGADIAPLHADSDGKLHRVMFSDCATGTEYPADEPGWIPRDRIYAVTEGEVVERHDDAASSTLGRYLILRHTWPGTETYFFSLYAHLDEITAATGQCITGGATIATMGQTSSSDDARTWMTIAPHVHLEFYDEAGRSFDPEKMLRALIVNER